MNQTFFWNDHIQEQFVMLPVELIWFFCDVQYLLCAHSAVGFTTREFSCKTEFHMSDFVIKNDELLISKYRLLEKSSNAKIFYK